MNIFDDVYSSYKRLIKYFYKKTEKINMISNFNKQLIEEIKKLNTNKFSESLRVYKKILNEQPAEKTALPQPTENLPPAEQKQQTPPAPEEEIPQTRTEKSYTDLLIIIAKALKANLMGSAKFGTSNFDSYNYLKDFAESWIAQEQQAEQITDKQAVSKITEIQNHLDNILGKPEQSTPV